MKIYALLTFFLYFALGSSLPLLSEYLVKIGFTGTQVGTVFSIGTFMTIIFQPLWGFVADRTNQIKRVLIFLTIISAAIAFIFPFFKTYAMIIIIYALLQIFFCGTLPLNDAGILHSPYPYGSIRLFGALGFAIAVQISAFLADYVSKYMIFILTGAALLLVVYFANKIKFNNDNSEAMNKKLLKELFKNKDYLFFILVGFFIGGTINAHNTYFGLLYLELGGQVTGIGFAFLLFAMSEVPCLKASTFIIKKIGINSYLILAGALFCIRWFFYGMAPSPNVVLMTFFLQGLSLGSFLAGTAEYIKLHTKKSQTATAITFYNSIALGIGAMICIFLSGIIMDAYSVATVYKFYFAWSLVGFLLLVALVVKERKALIAGKQVG